MTKLIVLRHGQSQWNLENRFTGWVDVDLTKEGEKEATSAADRLIDAGLANIDRAYCSRQKRAIRTLWIVLGGIDRVWVDVERHWQLNERHYGVLQGLNKEETIKKYGEEQVHIWRRSYDSPPEPVSVDSPMYPGNEDRYSSIDKSLLPKTESLKQVRERIIPLWHSVIAPQIDAGKQLLITAHGNSLRALAMYLTDMSPQQVMDFNIATGTPLVFEMDGADTTKDMYFLD